MAAPVTTGRLDATEFTPLLPEDGGWIAVEGDAVARVHTLCESANAWSGVALLEPCTFDYPVSSMPAQSSCPKDRRPSRWAIGTGT